MTIIRQPSLFGIQELYDMEPTQKYEEIISAIDLDSIYHKITKFASWCTSRTKLRSHDYFLCREICGAYPNN